MRIRGRFGILAIAIAGLLAFSACQTTQAVPEDPVGQSVSSDLQMSIRVYESPT